MKIIYTLIIAATVSLWYLWVSAYTNHNVESANFLAGKRVINDNSSNPFNYNLDFNITRREMLKVLMKLSEKNVPETCSWSFSDLSSQDWGCKYAEAALANGYIAANSTFRPNDLVTQIEALKMIMQGKWIQRHANEDWRAGYQSKARSEKIIDDEYLDYDLNAVRGWIFSTSARSFSDFRYIEKEPEIPKEVDDLFKEIYDL